MVDTRDMFPVGVFVVADVSCDAGFDGERRMWENSQRVWDSII